MNVENYSDEKFLKLQQRVIKDLTLTPNNVMEKTLELPVLHTKYQRLYFEQRKILKNINIEVNKTKAQKYHRYKFGTDLKGEDKTDKRSFRTDNATERNIYIEGDDDVCELYMMLHKQECVVDFLKDTISQITKMGYNIRSYIDLEKLRNGVMS